MPAAEILDTLCRHLIEGIQENIIELVTYGRGQARRESVENEVIIGKALQSFTRGHPMFQGDLSFAVATNGSWYDFVVRSADGTTFVPINLKVSTLQGQDNVASKAGLFYALTGVMPSNPLIRNWEEFCRNLANSLQREGCEADYYFLVVEKSREGVGRVFWTSLLRLRMVKPNGSNPPFQACWQENQEHSGRSREDAIDYLLETLGETFALRAKALDSFRAHLVPTLANERRARWQAGVPHVEGETD
mgnify:CR=1 FL=1